MEDVSVTAPLGAVHTQRVGITSLEGLISGLNLAEPAVDAVNELGTKTSG
jgi:hypothetical protein